MAMRVESESLDYVKLKYCKIKVLPTKGFVK